MTDFLTQLQSAVGAAYEIERELAGGGMSRVFVASERALGRRVVIKVLPPDLAAGVNKERFRREIQLAAQLHHPHIVPLLSAGEGDGIIYYTMPYIEGESLRVAVERHGKLPVADVVRVLHDVVDALAYAHRRGVIHRDIKPANILRLGAHALVTDFGVAKALSAAMPISGVTTAGIAIGTPAYMAPEQLAGDPTADHRLDLYAVGLLAYELLVGASPFSASSPAATMAAQLTRTPEPLHDLRPEVPAELSALIMRCLEKNPEHRPATADELQAELESVSTPRGALISGETLSPTPRASAARGALLGAAVVVALSGIGYALALMKGGDPSPAADSARGTRSASAGRAGRGAGGTPSQSRGSGSAATRPAPVQLTAADSLAIAEAVAARLERERAGQSNQDSRAQVMSDSLRAEYWQTFADSIERTIEQIRVDMSAALGEASGAAATAQRNRSSQMVRPLPPPREGERRVVVLPFTNRTGEGSNSREAREIAESVRDALRDRGAFSVVDERTTEAVSRGPAVPSLVGTMLHAPAVVSGQLFRRDSALVLRVQVTGRSSVPDSRGERSLRAREIRIDRGLRQREIVQLVTDSITADLERMRFDPPTRQGRRGGGSPPAFSPPSPPPPGQVASPPPPPPPVD